jgi:hypothetical protein
MLVKAKFANIRLKENIAVETKRKKLVKKCSNRTFLIGEYQNRTQLVKIIK